MEDRKSFNLEILTPDRMFFKGETQSLIVDTPAGKMGVLYNMMPVVTMLKPGSINFLQNDKWQSAHSGEGFISVRKDVVTIMAESCRFPHEKEESLTSDEAENEEEQRKKQTSLREYKMMHAQLSAQFIKLRKKK